MDPARYYGPYRIVETSITFLIGQNQQVAQENMERVCLIFSSPTGNAIFVSTKSTVTTNRGIDIAQNVVPYVEFTFDRHGPLVGQAWYGFAAAASTLTVIEVIREYDPDNPLWLRWNPNDGGA